MRANLGISRMMILLFKYFCKKLQYLISRGKVLLFGLGKAYEVACLSFTLCLVECRLTPYLMSVLSWLHKTTPHPQESQRLWAPLFSALAVGLMTLQCGSCFASPLKSLLWWPNGLDESQISVSKVKNMNQDGLNVPIHGVGRPTIRVCPGLHSF